MEISRDMHSCKMDVMIVDFKDEADILIKQKGKYSTICNERGWVKLSISQNMSRMNNHCSIH